jgi:hypothetical protein
MTRTQRRAQVHRRQDAQGQVVLHLADDLDVGVRKMSVLTSKESADETG